MNVILWVLQIVLALMFAAAGIMKAAQPKEKLAHMLPWVEDSSPMTVRFIGVVELLGAVGLILPAALGITPLLTPLAATGLAAVMGLAALTHFRRREPGSITFNAALFLVAAFIAWGRFGPYSF
ncbi:DoxX family protein [Sinomonas sp. G460-2]|uniref:DoxX family protein n=1 Tax=Sinomonas sp. G460-2 TaxID=3393464 RepID=UPI0039EFAAF1